MSTPQQGDAEARFFGKIEKPNGDDGCWIWHGSKNSRGYGRFYPGRPLPSVYAHRWSYERFVGRIPAGLQIDHLCRVKHCVNPAHLEPVTARENMHRADSPSIVASRTGKCQRGHDLPDFPDRQGKRRCLVCHQERLRAARLQRRTKAIESANRQRCPSFIKDAIWERTGGLCDFCGRTVAAKRQMQVHHRKLRSQGGDWSLDNLMGLHQWCHNIGPDSIHQNVTRSYELGHLVHSWADPSTVPIERGWSLRRLSVVTDTDGAA